MSESRLSRWFTAAAGAVDRRIGWDRLPRALGIVAFVGLRRTLRRENLHDTGPFGPGGTAPPPPPPPDPRGTRTLDGSHNDLAQPRTGMVGCRFGRNVPLARTEPEKDHDLLWPSPRVVSRELLTRRSFVPATTLNVLAAAWLQFEVHDWFSHGKNPGADPWLVPLQDDDPWEERPMRIQRTRPDPTYDPAEGIPPTFATTESHWWDASQLYGSDPEWAARSRTGEDGKLRIAGDGLPPADLHVGLDPAGPAGAFWLGLGLLHTLFAREHNAVCDALRCEYPSWSDEQLYQKARLVVAALMAKIHTVEWTPGIIAHPTTQLGMRINWWGLAGERVKRRVGRISRHELISGIPGSPTADHGVPYSLTEEFVAVYRMHPLLPDEFSFRSVADGSPVADLTFEDIDARHARSRLAELSMENCLYSFGVGHPGAVTLHNYPRFLQRFVRPIPPDAGDGQVPVVDLAAVDVLRDRERGVPRYNEFRRLFHRRPVATFAELTPDRRWAAEIRDVYEGDLDRVDLMVGAYAEPRPRGFGFSDTAFRVFMLMASRRLNCDRFLTADYRPEVYTPLGMRWIDDNTMRSVLLRHYPALEPALAGVANAFAPWRPVRR